MKRGTELLCVALVACADKTPPPPRVATVVSATGDATQNGKALVPGDKLALDVPIVIGEGRVEAQLSWAGTLRLFPRSQVVLASVGGEQKRDVKLVTGKLWALISGLNGRSFEVETSNAVAGVRGTQFIVEEDSVYVVEGEVEVAHKNDPKTKKRVKAGQRTQVAAAGEPTEPEAHASQAHEVQWNGAASEPVTLPKDEPKPEPVPADPEPEEPKVAPDDDDDTDDKPSKKKKKTKAQAKPKKADATPTPAPPQQDEPPPPPNKATKRNAFEFGQKPAGPPPTQWPPPKTK